MGSSLGDWDTTGMIIMVSPQLVHFKLTGWPRNAADIAKALQLNKALWGPVIQAILQGNICRMQCMMPYAMVSQDLDLQN